MSNDTLPAEPHVFKAGDICYSVNGEEGLYVAESTVCDGHVVQPVVWYGGGAPDDPPYMEAHTAAVWDEVFEAPPRAKLNDEVQQLIAERDALATEVQALRDEKLEAGRSHKEQLTRLKLHRALDRIEDFLACKMTHAVLYDDYYRVEVTPMQEAVKNGDTVGYSKELRLVTLFGKSNGDLEWRINRYYDGSGSNDNKALFFMDEESAMAAARAMCTENMRKLLAEAVPRDYYLSAALDVAVKLGAEIPVEAKHRVLAYRLAEKQELVNKAKAQYDLASNELKSVHLQPRLTSA